MALSYTARRNLCGKMCGDSSAANLVILDTLLNEADREICTMKPWSFREKSGTITTVASQQFYDIPGRFAKLITGTVTIGSTRWTPQECKTREDWDRLNQATNVTSDIPQYFFLYDGQIGFYPKPSSSGNTITYNYLVTSKDLSIADYTAGTITSIANGATTVTGSGTSWTSKMAGRFIRFTDSDTANTGDGYWYEISSVTSATVLELKSPYDGDSISAGTAAYTIAQLPIIPENFQMVPIHRALEQYFKYIKPEPERAKAAADDFARGVKRLQVEAGSDVV